VNLDDIAALIREGKDLKVVDAKTGQDLTRVTLTQIITEDAKESRPACHSNCCASSSSPPTKCGRSSSCGI
jgi:hypothetical protein